MCLNIFSETCDLQDMYVNGYRNGYSFKFVYVPKFQNYFCVRTMNNNNSIIIID